MLSPILSAPITSAGGRSGHYIAVERDCKVKNLIILALCVLACGIHRKEIKPPVDNPIEDAYEYEAIISQRHLMAIVDSLDFERELREVSLEAQVQLCKAKLIRAIQWNDPKKDFYFRMLTRVQKGAGK